MICLNLEVHYLLLPWRDVLLQLLDLVVQHILKLLQFLRLLLELVDLFLAFANRLVFLSQFFRQQCEFSLLFLCRFILLFYLLILIHTRAFEFVVVLLDVFVLVVIELALGGGLELHVIDCGLVVGVLLLDVLNFVFSVLLDGLQGRFVFFAGALDVLLELCDLGITELHLFAMLFFFEVYLLLVFNFALFEGLVVVAFFLLLCQLQHLIL